MIHSDVNYLNFKNVGNRWHQNTILEAQIKFGKKLTYFILILLVLIIFFSILIYASLSNLSIK